MGAILYTTTEAIRAAVGVTTKEFPDAMLKDQGLEAQMRTDVYGWLPTHAAVYSAGTAASPTAEEEYLKDLLVQYCMFYGAVRVVEMVMAMRQKVGDGKSQVERFNIDWPLLLSNLNDRKNAAREAIEEVTEVTSGAVSYFGRAVPSYDPVTNT